ncbi:MAG: glutathione S-transferase family protein [Pseudomonadota bacterium]
MSNPRIVLHHCPQTRSMRTLWLLYELGVPFELVEHAFGKNLRDPSFLAKSPAGRVPALEFDGQSLMETGAMAELLCERFAQAGLGRRPEDPERLDWLQWVHFAETISQHAASLTQQHIVLYKDEMRSPVLMKIEAARLAKCYEAMEPLLSTQDYLLSGFSAADIGVGQAVYMARHFAKTDPYPGVQAWFERITERLAFQKCLPGDVRLYAQDFYPAWDVA